MTTAGQPCESLGHRKAYRWDGDWEEFSTWPKLDKKEHVALILGLQAFVKVISLMFEKRFLYIVLGVSQVPATRISRSKRMTPPCTAPGEMMDECIVLDIPSPSSSLG